MPYLYTEPDVAPQAVLMVTTATLHDMLHPAESWAFLCRYLSCASPTMGHCSSLPQSWQYDISAAS